MLESLTPRHRLHRLHQTLAVEVSVAAGGADVGVTEQLLHLIQTAPRVDQKTGKTVAQIVHPQIRQTRALASGVPTAKHCGWEKFKCRVFPAASPPLRRGATSDFLIDARFCGVVQADEAVPRVFRRHYALGLWHRWPVAITSGMACVCYAAQR